MLSRFRTSLTLVHWAVWGPLVLSLVASACGTSSESDYEEPKPLPSEERVAEQPPEAQPSAEPAPEPPTPTPTAALAAATPDPGPRTVATARPAPQRFGAPRTKVAWLRDVGDGTDVLSFGDQLILMGVDSADALGERVLLDRPASYARPMVTPSGNEIVFSIRQEGAIYAIGWDGSRPRRVTDGFALAVWVDPATGVEWVYAGRRERPTDPPSYRALRRYRLDNPDRGERVWNAQPVSGDGFQLSRDGRYAAGLFPWPDAGTADLAAGTWERLGRGCWTAFSGGDHQMFWYFDGSHRYVTLVDIESDRRWRVTVNGAPGIDGFEVWHPRWTNDARYLVLTGPYSAGQGENKIRGGGNQVEVYLGRFSADFTTIDRWHQITHNDAPDFYPDAWIDPTNRALEESRAARPSADSSSPGAPDAASTRLVVDARVLHHTPVPTPASIAPYKHGLLAMEYEVLDVIDGRYDEPTLVVAHWVIREGEVLDDAHRPRGDVSRLTLELYDTRHELEGERLVMETNQFRLPLYYDATGW